MKLQETIEQIKSDSTVADLVPINVTSSKAIYTMLRISDDETAREEKVVLFIVNAGTENESVYFSGQNTITKLADEAKAKAEAKAEAIANPVEVKPINENPLPVKVTVFTDAVNAKFSSFKEQVEWLKIDRIDEANKIAYVSAYIAVDKAVKRASGIIYYKGEVLTLAFEA
jgi:hypothetical protein